VTQVTPAGGLRLDAWWVHAQDEEDAGRIEAASDGTLLSFRVRNFLRGLGLGRQLLQGLVAEAEVRGVPRLKVAKECLDLRMQRLLETAGFAPDDMGSWVLPLRRPAGRSPA